MHKTSDTSALLVARYAPAIYLVAALMMLMPSIDIVLSLPGYQLGNGQWRFGAIGLLSGGMLLPIAGLLLASLTAVFARQRWVHRIVLVLSGMLLLFLVLMAGSFALDAIELRGRANPTVLGTYDITVVKTLVMQFAEIVAVALVMRSDWRAWRTAPLMHREEPGSELVAGMMAH